MNQNLASNLTYFRQMHELSQKDVAEKAGLSLPGYRALETGRSTPRSATLARLAKVYSIQATDLLAHRTSLTSVRFRSKGVVRRREQILFKTQKWLEAFHALEEAVGDRSISKVNSLQDIAQSYRKRPEEAARHIRASLGLGQDETIRDVAGLVEHAGVKVFQCPLDSTMFFGLAVGVEGGGPAIVVNTNTKITVERWIFTVAHEFGHLLLHSDSFKVSEVDEIEDQEREADAFAGLFLMPDGVFSKEWDGSEGLPFLDRVLKVKRIFRVSYMTVLYRLVKTGRAEASAWDDFRAKYKARVGQSLGPADEPGPLEAEGFRLGQPPIRRSAEPAQLDDADFVEDQFARLIRRAFLEEKISLGRAAELLDVPLVEMRSRAAEWQD